MKEDGMENVSFALFTSITGHYGGLKVKFDVQQYEYMDSYTAGAGFRVCLRYSVIFGKLVLKGVIKRCAMNLVIIILHIY